MQKKQLIKEVVFISISIALFFCSAFALKSIFFEKSKLFLINQHTKKEVKIDCAKGDFISVFGKPDMEQKYFFETDDKMGSVVIYKKDQFYFLDGKLESFTILTSNFALKIEKDFPAFSIGRSVQFPKGISKQSSAFVTYDLKNSNGSSTDQFLEFDLIPNSHQIKKIHLGDY